MIDVEEFDCNPGAVGQGTTSVTLTFKGRASDDATSVEVVYSLAKDKPLFWSHPADGTIDESGKAMTVNTLFNVLPAPFAHHAQLNVGNGFQQGEQFRIKQTATEQGGNRRTSHKFIVLQ